MKHTARRCLRPLAAQQRGQRHCADALVVHRLDMATSGLLLMARGPGLQRALSTAFAQRQVHKRYVAVVARPQVLPPPA